jgi:hypothetical protein
MLYIGIDYHRRYSVLRTVDDAGDRVKAACMSRADGVMFTLYLGNACNEREQRAPMPNRRSHALTVCVRPGAPDCDLIVRNTMSEW